MAADGVSNEHLLQDTTTGCTAAGASVARPDTVYYGEVDWKGQQGNVAGLRFFKKPNDRPVLINMEESLR